MLLPASVSLFLFGSHKSCIKFFFSLRWFTALFIFEVLLAPFLRYSTYSFADIAKNFAKKLIGDKNANGFWHILLMYLQELRKILENNGYCDLFVLFFSSLYIFWESKKTEQWTKFELFLLIFRLELSQFNSFCSFLVLHFEKSAEINSIT